MPPGVSLNIDKEILENININKISNLLEFGISNRANSQSSIFFFLFESDMCMAEAHLSSIANILVGAGRVCEQNN